MLTSCRFIVVLAVLSSPAIAGAARQPQPAGVRGRVVDPADHRLPGVSVALKRWSGDVSIDAAPIAAETTTDAAGDFAFDAVVPGSFVVVATLDGYDVFAHSPLDVTDAELVTLYLNLQISAIAEALEIVGSVGAATPSVKEEFGTNLLSVFPLPTDRFHDVLPQLPGVVRDPRGRISFNGTRPSQSALLVNGATATDPVTGEFAVELPLKAIETVEVFTVPYSAEFGRVTGAVANVRTRAGDDHWDIDVGNIWPSLRWRDGTVKGLNSVTPRVQVSDPLAKGRAWISQGFTYRFIRSRVYDAAPGAVDEEILEGFDSFTQLDIKFGEGHSATPTVSFFPVETANLGIDTLHPAPATPEFGSRGWNVAMTDRLTTSSNTHWETTVALRRFDVTSARTGSNTTRLTVDGLLDNYFNEIDRRSMQTEFGLSCLHFVPSLFGPRVLKMGGNLYYTAFDGTDRSFPIDLIDATGRRHERIEFLGSGLVDAADVAIGAYVQDQWRPTSNLALDLGVRYDYERITDAHHVAPRVAFAYSLRGDGLTIVKGGWGLFFDQVFLHAASFEHFQERRETLFDPVDGQILQRLIFRNVIAAEGLHVPRSKAWNIELNHQIGANWMVRVNYRERRASRTLTVDRLPNAAGGPVLRLSSHGQGKIREFDTTLRRRMPGNTALFLSFSKRRTTGDLKCLPVQLRRPAVRARGRLRDGAAGAAPVSAHRAHHRRRSTLAGFKGSSQHVLAGVRVAVR